jgi:hypothetical protein
MRRVGATSDSCFVMSEVNPIPRQESTWQSRVGLLDIVPAVVTLIAGFCLAIGFSADNLDGLYWLMWGAVFSVLATCWTVVATLIAVTALAWPAHQPFSRPRSRPEVTAMLAANGAVLVVWILCILATMVAAGAVVLALMLVLGVLAILSELVISIHAARRWLVITRPERAAIALTLATNTAVLLLTGLWLTGRL